MMAEGEKREIQILYGMLCCGCRRMVNRKRKKTCSWGKV